MIEIFNNKNSNNKKSNMDCFSNESNGPMGSEERKTYLSLLPLGCLSLFSSENSTSPSLSKEKISFKYVFLIPIRNF